MLDTRFDKDCIFMVFEHDFRWYPEGKESRAMARRLEEALVVHGERSAADLGAAPVTPPLKRDPRIHHQSGPQTCQLNRGSVGKNGEGLLQEVLDCVQYSIMAHRGGHGGCIWFLGALVRESRCQVMGSAS